MRRDSLALSLIYDTLLFAVLVSLSAAALLPAVTTSITRNTSLEKHRELEVDDTLTTLLDTRPDPFTYTFAGPILDTTASSLGVNTSSPGLYQMIKDWILTNTPRHETTASLLAEDLASQLQIPTSTTTHVNLNILTSDLDTQLQAHIKNYLDERLQGRYLYNITAIWHPLVGIPFGGSLTIGPRPPLQTSHVASRTIAVPIPPAIRLGNTTITLTHHGLARYLTDINLTGNTTIPQITSIRTTLNAYLHHQPPYDDRPTAHTSLEENLTSLLDAILIRGLQNTTNATIFPGIVNATITTTLARITTLFTNLTQTALNDTFGGLLDNTHTILTSLNTSTPHLTDWLLTPFNTTLSNLLNTTFPTLPDALNATRTWALNQTEQTTNQLLAPHITAFTDTLLNVTDSLAALNDLLQHWILDRLNIQSAHVTLTIWTTQP
jgi:hypothetical protein